MNEIKLETERMNKYLEALNEYKNKHVEALEIGNFDNEHDAYVRGKIKAFEEVLNALMYSR